MEANVEKVVNRFPGSLRAQVEALAGIDRKANPRIRLGQSLFNALYVINPVLADSIRAKDLDPFYKDEYVPAFLAWIDSVEDKSAT
jgi:hypothetical protein